MVAKRETRKSAAAGAAWRLFMDVVFQHQGHFLTLAQKFGLNPGSLKLLISLDPKQPAPMSSAASLMQCDASTVTWLVDRLEEKALVERKPSPNDRRVKTIALTKKGIVTQQQIDAMLYEPPPALDALTDEDLEGLAKALRKIRAAQTGAMPSAS